MKKVTHLPDDELLSLRQAGSHDASTEVYNRYWNKLYFKSETNLGEIFAIIKKRKIPLVWIRTTEVVDSIHRNNRGFHRYAKGLEQYNTIADEEVHKAGIASLDLYGFTKELGANRFIDRVHYKEKIRALQAACIAGLLQSRETRP